jgi:hypothetical protein
MGETYSPERSTAIHEAGHAVLAYLLGRRFTEISVVPDEDNGNLGSVRHAPPGGDWLHPDIEPNGRVRNWLEREIMICLAGAETEAAWLRRITDAPDDWEDRVSTGASHDMENAMHFGFHMCDGSVPELEAYLEWLRQRVLRWTGRRLSEREVGHPKAVVRRIEDDDPRFWALVTALADAVQEAGTLTWRKARTVLRQADERCFDALLDQGRRRRDAPK